VVYSFGEAEYYYDQFYDPYRDYPAPIFAIAGNHDGMVAPTTNTPTLKAFLENFCTAGKPLHRTPEAGNLVRTVGLQPGVYFTLEAPFVRIIGLYSNVLEDPGIISSQATLGPKAKKYPNLSDVQIDFLKTALTRAKTESKPGAVIIAVHHPPYVAIDPSKKQTAGKHGNSPQMLADIDRVCALVKFWSNAVLCGHAHNYQRFTRYDDKRETPYVLCGNGGHAHNPLTKKDCPPCVLPLKSPYFPIEAIE
jgi:Calcineurin-like phosphoesterase